MKKKLIIATCLALLAHNSAYAINAKYREQLERSGCTQVTEAQGCDITKTKAENAKAGFIGAGASAAQPSFNCSKATHEIEQLICSDDELAALDVSLSNLYKTVRKNTPAAAQKRLKAEQSGWVKGRNDCWKADDKRSCVKSEYETRINELKDR